MLAVVDVESRIPVDHPLRTIKCLADAALAELSPVFESPLGNILLLERRMLGDRLVLSCERGLVEVDISQVPTVVERARATTNGSMAVVSSANR